MQRHTMLACILPRKLRCPTATHSNIAEEPCALQPGRLVALVVLTVHTNSVTCSASRFGRRLKGLDWIRNVELRPGCFSDGLGPPIVSYMRGLWATWDGPVPPELYGSNCAHTLVDPRVQSTENQLRRGYVLALDAVGFCRLGSFSTFRR
ncbi:hypothetical protein BJX76DRAFT_340052 [Aspergillus varians]